MLLVKKCQFVESFLNDLFLFYPRVLKMAKAQQPEALLGFHEMDLDSRLLKVGRSCICNSSVQSILNSLYNFTAGHKKTEVVRAYSDSGTFLLIRWSVLC